MKKSGLITILVISLSLLIASLVYAFKAEIDIVGDRDNAEIKRALALEVTAELRRSSDELTTAARTYAATGDQRYEQYFIEILAIRAGSQPRPVQYANVYWDSVFANHKKPRSESAISVSIYDLAKGSEMTSAELGYISESFQLSEKLARLEEKSFNAIKGRYKDASGEYSMLDIPDLKLAEQILFSEEYFKGKSLIVAPIGKLYISIIDRTGIQLKEIFIKESEISQIIIALMILIVANTAILGYVVYKRSSRAQQETEKENEALNDSVINILQAVHSLSEKDLTVRAPVTEDVIGTVSDSINQLADETSTVLINVTRIAGQVSQVSNTVHNQAAQVSKTAKEERQSVQKMIETLFDATQTMNQVTALAEMSSESAEQATTVTAEALSQVNKTVDGMENIRETISETEKRIKRLGERSQEISGIVNLINTISERTHVLALNASMQAAVAGDAGRGFAVVAEEVQQLAESSRNATEQIATLVNNIQIETNETINTVNRTIGQVVEGSEQAQQAGVQMRRTQEITAELVSRVNSIASASQQQKEMSGQLLEAVQEIGESTEKTAEQIEAQNKGATVLQRAAKSLVDSVSVFKLPKADS